MVVLHLLEPSATANQLQIRASPTDSINHIRSQIALRHPLSPSLDDIRLVRAGRLLADTETVQDVLGGVIGSGEEDTEGETHTIHLVLRPDGRASKTTPNRTGASSVGVSHSANMGNDDVSIALSGPSSSELAATPELSTGLPPFAADSYPYTSTAPIDPSFYRSITDALAFYTFESQSALFQFINVPTQSMNKWEDLSPPPVVPWDVARLVVHALVTNLGIESGLEGAGSEHRGRLEEWIGPEGGEWPIIIDDMPYQLSVPPLSTLSTAQRTALHSYLLYSSRQDILTNLLATHLYPSFPLSFSSHIEPTPTIPAAAPVAPGVSAEVRTRMIKAMILLGMNFVKYALVWYVFTREEDTMESIVWAVGLLGWWMYEGFLEIRRAQVGGDETRGGVAGGAGGAGRGSAPETRSGSADGESHTIFVLPVPPTPLHRVALIGLERESALLRFSSSSTPSETTSTEMLTSSGCLPLWLKVVLFPVLFVTSALPPLDAFRRSTLRRRENLIRERVGSLSPSPSLAESAPAPQDAHGQGQGQTRRTLPAGLSAQAKMFYHRVLDRGDRVDWAEEEEAQREILEREDRERRNREGDGDGGFWNFLL
ncbi:Ubiquitin domain [Phaffia rhodozyma]|uniref:Ubiquitin domain n=1 Tax=Phaffia rhodozyma TaxID=264483 RepID=A0A0F7SW84_PHARH|nr:Ubiquitin domain [Phaffia rhodozyma]